MTKVDLRLWDDIREDRKREKRLKKRKNIKEAKNKKKKQKYTKKQKQLYIYIYIFKEKQMDKLGSYISKLMITVLDKEQEEFVKDLALSELTRLNVDINDFVRKHTKDISDEIEKRKKQLLQEDKNVKDK